MRRTSGWRVAIAGSVVTVMMIVAGCSPWGAPRDEKRLREAIIAEVPGVEAALVSFNADVFTQKILVKLSMPKTKIDESEIFLSTVDKALEIAWKEAPFEPTSVSIMIWIEEFEDDEPPNLFGIGWEGIAGAEGAPGESSGVGWIADTEELEDAYGSRD